MNSYDGKVTLKVTIPVSLMCIISLVTFITPAHAAVGDLILDSEILLREPDFHDAKNDTGSTTLLKEGYSLSLDKVWWNETGPGKQIGVANFSIFENGKVVKRLSANEEDYFYYNKTIDGREYTIIESKVDAIFSGYYHLVKLRPVRQYSDGSPISEPDFITASLNPYTNETPPEKWNRTFGGVYDDFGRYGRSVQQTSDGGYILIGSIKRCMHPLLNSMYYNYAYLIKTDTNGNEQWNRTFEHIGINNAHSVWQTADGGYILGGVVCTSRDRGSVRLVKTDPYGNITWHTTIDALNDDFDYDSVMSIR